MKQHDGFIKNSDVNVLLAGGGHKPLSDFLDASSFKTVNGQSLIGIGDISAGGETIVPSSGSTLTAEVGKYYRYDTAVNSLTVTLPSTALFTSTQKIIIYFQANTSNALTLSSSDNIKYMDGYDIESGSTYEVTIMWNGYSWIVTSMMLDGLPAGAKRIEYLETSGTQYIDSGFKFTLDLASGVDIKYMLNSTSGGLSVIGSCTSNDGSWFVMYQSGGAFYVGSSAALFSNSISANTIYEVSYRINSNNTISQSWNGSLSSKSYTGTIVSGSNIGIFDQLYNSSPSGRRPSGKIYYCKIINGGNLVRNMIPIRIGQIGYLYDKVSKQTFGNSGSGSFILGPDK